jgi:hypothetical protein
MLYSLETIQPEWCLETLPPFREAILTWNGERPSRGLFRFWIRVKTDLWSQWLPYADWGSAGQSTGASEENAFVLDQDELRVRRTATGIAVRIDSIGGADYSCLRSLHLYADPIPVAPSISMDTSLRLPVPGISQMALSHPRCRDLCSPTSTAAVLRFLNTSVDPLILADYAHDQFHDIYGNWSLNIAAAAQILGSSWRCWVEKLSGLPALYQRLLRGLPTIVSVRGPLPGAPLPYDRGHLLVVTGYTPSDQTVACMDPAFSADEQTHVVYQWDDFSAAWNRRGRLAYIFEPA